MYFLYSVRNYSRSQAEGSENHDCRTLAECDSCIKYGFKMRFSLTVFSLST